MKNKYPLVYIEWCDAIDTGLGWETIRITKQWAKTNEWVIKQAGWIVKETKKYIVICAKYNPQEDNYQGMVSHTTKIPKTWILKRKTIKL
jgi:hypothetical protein